MKTRGNSFEFLVLSFKFPDLRFISAFLLSIFIPVLNDQAQTGPMGNVKDGHSTSFTSDQYFEPPNGQHIKMRLSGASAQSLPNGVMDIRDLKIETFTLDGKTEAIIRAPQCNYAFMVGQASSEGPLEVRTGDGRMVTTGDGFLWRQSDNSLNISNNVLTVIQAGDLKLTVP